MFEDAPVDSQYAALFLVSSYVHDGNTSPEFLRILDATCEILCVDYYQEVGISFQTMRNMYSQRRIEEDPAIDELITLKHIDHVYDLYKKLYRKAVHELGNTKTASYGLAAPNIQSKVLDN